MTPTNEAGHGLPELPEPLISGGNDNSRPDLGRGCTGYTAAQVQQYAKDYAAALALSRGVPADMVLVPRPRAPTREHIEAFKRAEIKCISDYDDDMSPEYRGLEAVFAMLAATPAAAGAQGEDASAAVIRASLRKVIDAVGAYLPPDGISQEDLISLVIEATDNPEIVRAMK